MYWIGPGAVVRSGSGDDLPDLRTIGQAAGQDQVDERRYRRGSLSSFRIPIRWNVWLFRRVGRTCQASRFDDSPRDRHRFQELVGKIAIENPGTSMLDVVQIQSRAAMGLLEIKLEPAPGGLRIFAHGSMACMLLASGTSRIDDYDIRVNESLTTEMSHG